MRDASAVFSFVCHGPRGSRTPNQPVMLPTAAFAVPFECVGWTLSSPAWGACRRVSTPSRVADDTRLARDYPACSHEAFHEASLGFPEFDRLYRKIAPSAAHCKQPSLCHNAVMDDTQNCVVCFASLSGRQKMFCSTECKNKKHQSYKAQQDRGLNRKLRLIQSLGGACSICGYKTNVAAFNFHHADPQHKIFKLDMRSLSNRTWSTVLQETKKCSLVCANCHAELHNPHLNLGHLLQAGCSNH